MAQLSLEVVGVISIWAEVSRSLMTTSRAEDIDIGALQILLYGSLKSRHVPAVPFRSRGVQAFIRVCFSRLCTSISRRELRQRPLAYVLYDRVPSSTHESLQVLFLAILLVFGICTIHVGRCLPSKSLTQSINYGTSPQSLSPTSRIRLAPRNRRSCRVSFRSRSMGQHCA